MNQNQDDTAITTNTTTNNKANNDNNNKSSRVDDNDDDHHQHDMVMPGFRFHPTEEELVEFYLRRKVEGKRFQPWQQLERRNGFFYVPRDKKYRNGDRPNRVTTSGYWKATGADRMIRTENFRSIGLKKTLVFYSGKAPKGIRSSWIMNEYRLPQHETERYQKAEISLCRVYKRAGVEDHPSLPRCLLSRASSSRSGGNGTHPDKKKPHKIHQNITFGGQHHHQQVDHQLIDKMSETDGSSATSSDATTGLGLSKHNSNTYHTIPSISTTMGGVVPNPMDDEDE
ncbi:NAC domain containing protein, partial [Quillaja saponaria]